MTQDMHYTVDMDHLRDVLTPPARTHLDPALRYADGAWTLDGAAVRLTDAQVIERRSHLLTLNTLACGCTRASHVAQGCWAVQS